MNYRVGEILVVVALGKITALMGAARFLAIERAVDDRFREIEHETQLECLGQLRVEGVGMIIEGDILGALLQLTNLIGVFDQAAAVAINAASLLHRALHLFSNLRDPLGASGFAQE